MVSTRPKAQEQRFRHHLLVLLNVQSPVLVSVVKRFFTLWLCLRGEKRSDPVLWSTDDGGASSDDDRPLQHLGILGENVRDLLGCCHVGVRETKFLERRISTDQISGRILENLEERNDLLASGALRFEQIAPLVKGNAEIVGDLDSIAR